MRKKILIFAPILFLCLSSPINAENNELSPEAVKASYIINMRGFVEIGNPPHKPAKFCFYEKPGVPWNESVGQLIQRYLQNQGSDRAQGFTVQWYKAIRDISGCDIFYIPTDEAASIPSILAELDSSPTITVSGAAQFIYKGGMIGFILDNSNHVKMTGNIQNMRNHNIHADAQLLEIMTKVEGN